MAHSLNGTDLSAFTGAREKCAGMVRLTGVRAAGGCMVDEWRRMAGGKREGMGGRREEGRKPRYNGMYLYII